MDATAQPIRLSSQLRQHLRALREQRGLTQAQLGRLLGVKQARVAEIESNPGAVSVDQLIRVFGALGATMYLDQSNTGAAGRVVVQPVRQKVIGKAPQRTQRSRQRRANAAIAAKRSPKTRASVPSRPSTPAVPKKGIW